MAKAASFFLGEHDYFNGFFRKSFKHSLSITYTSDPRYADFSTPFWFSPLSVISYWGAAWKPADKWFTLA
jgi:hypothetical protein